MRQIIAARADWGAFWSQKSCDFFSDFLDFFRSPTQPLKLKFGGSLYEKIKIIVETSNMAQIVDNTLRSKLYKTTWGLILLYHSQNFEKRTVSFLATTTYIG